MLFRKFRLRKKKNLSNNPGNDKDERTGMSSPPTFPSPLEEQHEFQAHPLGTAGAPRVPEVLDERYLRQRSPKKAS